MKELLETLSGWESAGTDPADVGRAVVVRTFGSAPRPEGANLLYARDGRIAGSVSGGCVEGAAAEEIDRARATGNARVIRYGIIGRAGMGCRPRLRRNDRRSRRAGRARGGGRCRAAVPSGRADMGRRSSRHSPRIRRPERSVPISQVKAPRRRRSWS